MNDSDRGMTTLTVTLPRPPSANNLFVTLPNRRRAVSPEYRQWRKDALAELWAQGPIRQLAPPYAVEIVVAQPDRRRNDIVNFEKAPVDLLVRHGVLTDDSEIDDIRVIRDRTKAWQGITVTVRSLAAAE